MEHSTDTGRIVYTSTRPEMAGRVRGGETFIVTRYLDGSRTLRVHCAIDENSPAAPPMMPPLAGPGSSPGLAGIALNPQLPHTHVVTPWDSLKCMSG